MDLEIQMKDDDLQDIFVYDTFVLPLRSKFRKGKMSAYPKLIFVQSFIKFKSMVPEIQMKRAKRDILYLHKRLLATH